VLGCPTLADDCDHLVPGVEDLLDLNRPVLEAVEPICQPLVGFIDPDEGPRTYCASKRRRVPDEIGMGHLGQELSGPLDVFVATPEQLEILPRHRRFSIPRRETRAVRSVFFAPT
jgi:hypothetical protein